MKIVLFAIKKGIRESEKFELGINAFIDPSDIIKYICVNDIGNITINYISYDSDKNGYEFEPLSVNKVILVQSWLIQFRRDRILFFLISLSGLDFSLKKDLFSFLLMLSSVVV